MDFASELFYEVIPALARVAHDEETCSEQVSLGRLFVFVNTLNPVP